MKESGYSSLLSYFQKQAPLAVRAKFAERKEKRLQDLEIDNPEKAEAMREKKRWQDAETRLKGEKVSLLKKLAYLNLNLLNFQLFYLIKFFGSENYRKNF